MSIAVCTDAEWQALGRAMGCPDGCVDPRFDGKPGRLVNVKDLDVMVGSWTRGYSAEDVVQVLQQHGVAAMGGDGRR